MSDTNTVDENNREDVPGENDQHGWLSRRMVLSLLWMGGLGTFASGSATAQSGSGQPFYNWKEDVDANGHTVSELGTLAMASNSTEITDFAGENLTINENGVLTATGTTGLWEDSDGDGLLETPDYSGTDVAMVNAKNGEFTNVSGVNLGPTEPKLQSYKREFSWQDIPWEDKGGPIEDGSESNSVDGAAFASLLHAESVLSNPIDTWYIYWSGHDRSAIELDTAPSPWGPWTYHGPVWTLSDAGGGGNHVASPSVIVDPERHRLNMYYHQPDKGQRTKLAIAPLSGDGTSFSSNGIVIDTTFDGSWNEKERSYLRVLRRGGSFIGVYQGRDQSGNSAEIGIARSYDGENWVLEPNPAYDGTQWTDFNPQSYNGGAPALSFIGGQITIHYGDTSAGVAKALPYADRNHAIFTPGETVYPSPDWSQGIPVVEEFVSDEKYVYMHYYTRETRDDGQQIFVLGVARAERGEII